MFEFFTTSLNDTIYKFSISSNIKNIYLYLHEDRIERFNFSITFKNKNICLQKSKPSELYKKIIKLVVENECTFSRWSSDNLEQYIIKFLTDTDKYLTKELLYNFDKSFEEKLISELSTVEKEYKDIDETFNKRIIKLEKEIKRVKIAHLKHKEYLPKKISKLKNRNNKILNKNT